MIASVRGLAVVALLALGCANKTEVSCPPDELSHLVLKEWSGMLRFPDGKNAPLTIRFKTRECKTTAELVFPDGIQLDATFFDRNAEGLVIEFPMSFSTEDMMSKDTKLILRGPVPAGEWRGNFEYGAQSGPLTLAPGNLDAALKELKGRHGEPRQPGTKFW